MDAKIREAIDAMKDATARLQTVCISELLVGEYQLRVAPLDQEDRQLEGERRTLSESRANLEPVIQAKARVLGRQADELAAAGDVEGATGKRAEACAVQANYEGIQGKISQIDARRTAIGEEKRAIARQLWEERYANLPAATFAVIESAVDLLDGIETGMYTFQKLVGLEPESIGSRPLIRRPHFEQLTPVPNGPSRFLAARVRKWLG